MNNGSCDMIRAQYTCTYIRGQFFVLDVGYRFFFLELCVGRLSRSFVSVVGF